VGTNNKHVDFSVRGCLEHGVCDARHIRDPEALSLVAMMPATKSDPHQMLRDVLSLLERRRGMLHCTIMLLTPDDEGLVLEAESAREVDGGTLFPDELGDFSPAIQVNLLRVIPQRECERVGSNKTLQADGSIVTATNRDLETALRDGEFREDLYYRINVFPIVPPPLCERRSDILLPANHFVEKYTVRLSHPVRRISTSAINLLMSYHWPGNVRELENCIEHAVLLCSAGVTYGPHLPPALQTPTMADCPAAGSFKTLVDRLERDLIIDALKRNRGNVTAAARELGVTGRMVRSKIERVGVVYDRFFTRKHRR